VDDSTFKRLKESKYHHPEVTEVIFEANQMFEMSLHSIGISEKGFDIVWDTIMVNFIKKYYKDGLQLLENQAKKRRLRRRLIVEVTTENIDFVNSLDYSEIRHVDNLRGNFAIFDERAYMVQLFHKDTEQPDQAFWSNSRAFVEKQQKLFDDLWEMAIPLLTRNNELKYQEKHEYNKILTNYNRIYQEVKSIIEQSRMELLILSSFQILQKFLVEKDFVNTISSTLKRGTIIKILTDEIYEDSISQIAGINKKNKDEGFQLGFSNKLGKFTELVIVSDGKYILQITYDQTTWIGSFSNKEHRVRVQEIIFEKYWNEIQSLKVINSTE